MGFHILLISFAVVIVGGLGSLKGTTISAFVLGMVMAITGRFWDRRRGHGFCCDGCGINL